MTIHGFQDMDMFGWMDEASYFFIWLDDEAGYFSVELDG
jgi:hypothetical protein